MFLQLFNKHGLKNSRIQLKDLSSGWMTIKQRIKQKNINLPIVISDHADWKELTDTIKEVSPEKVLVTHGKMRPY